MSRTPETTEADKPADTRRPSRPWTHAVTGYPIIVASGTVDSVGETAAKLVQAHRYAIITDATVRDLYSARVAAGLGGAPSSLLSIPAGEAHKTRETWARLTDDLIAQGHARDSAIIALGGGVVGDVAGFVAATFMRGIPYIQVPTTLLSMIDSSIGGKTGVDTPAGKNLVGAFHRPAAVVIDPDVLATLPRRELRAGLAEAIKHGVIADIGYFERVRAALPSILAAGGLGSPGLTDLIIRSVEIKGLVVERDELEGGLRKTLNFGHTIGHAVEAASGYSLLHGEAVAIGMALESELAERAGIATPGTTATLRKALARAELSSVLPPRTDPDRILEIIRADKKARAGGIELALPAAIGRMAGEDSGWTVRVPEAQIREILHTRPG